MIFLPYLKQRIAVMELTIEDKNATAVVKEVINMDKREWLKDS